jgi:hypothetical protein
MTASPLRIVALLAAPAVAAAAACADLAVPGDPAPAGVSAAPLIGGRATDADPAVVALLAPDQDEDAPFCTGTLVSPRVVLTAAHCVDRFTDQPAIAVFAGSDLRAGGDRLPVTAKAEHPDWQGDIGLHDLAMLLVAAPADPLAAAPLNDFTPLVDHLGEPYRLVGFGRHDRDDPLPDGVKREGTTLLTGWLRDTDVVLAGDAGDPDGLAVCLGDSGGPGFLRAAGAELLAGVHSFTTGEDCRPPAAETRVDLYAASVVRPWIEERDPTCAADGLCAPVGCIDDPDCARCDPDRDECPSGTRCRAFPPQGAVCTADQAPRGEPGDACAGPSDCATHVCRDGACASACLPAAGVGCPAGFTCEEGEDGRFCAPRSGCAVGRSGPGALFLAMTAMFAALLGISRSRRS